MTAANFDACHAETLRHEGGWANHKDDPGGATMKGVTLATFRRYRPGATKEALRNISDADLLRIYRDGYWNPVRGDELPNGLDLVAFDGAVNSGTKRGARWLQQALGVTADGKVGPVTTNRAWAVQDKAKAVSAACRARMGFLRGLRHWNTFGKGWSRRVASIEAVGIAMTGAGAGRLASEADAARQKQKAETGGAVATGTGGGAAPILDLPVEAIAFLVIVAAIIALIFAKRASHEKNRAEAFQAQAEKEAV